MTGRQHYQRRIHDTVSWNYDAVAWRTWRVGMEATIGRALGRQGFATIANSLSR